MRNTADRVDTTAAVWLGLTANCASCHDHKFDPLTQKEYYSLGAIFKGLADRVWDGNVRMSGPIAIVPPDRPTQQRIAELDATVPALEAALSARVERELASSPLPKWEKKPVRLRRSRDRRAPACGGRARRCRWGVAAGPCGSRAAPSGCSRFRPAIRFSR